MLGLFREKEEKIPIEKQKKAKKSAKNKPEKKQKTSEILKGLFASTLDGWRDDKEKFKIELINDIKSFLFGKWEKPWKAGLVFGEDGKVISGFRNITGRLYKNKENILSMERNGGKSPFYITIDALMKQGGKLIDKEKVLSVLSYIPIFKDKEDKTPRKPDWMLPKLHEAVNVDYCEDIKKPTFKKVAFINNELNEYVENFIKELVKKKRVPKIIHDQADRCFYRHEVLSFTNESIHMVDLKQFRKVDEYYSTLFHEITHSTQNPARLGRGDRNILNSLQYANEELVAEIGAMIICSELGLKYNRENSLVYLKGWLKSTKGNIDENLLEAYGYACDAAEYLLDGIDLSKLVPKSMTVRANEATEPEQNPIKKAATKKGKDQEGKIKKKDPKKTEENKPFIPRTSETELDYNLAYRAYTGTSFSPEKRAVSEQKSYAIILNDFAEELEKLATTEQKKNVAIAEFSTFKERFLKKKTAVLVAKSRCLSSMITGGSNFPVARNQKNNDIEHKRTGEYLEFIEKAQKGIINKIKKAVSKEEAIKESFEEVEKKAAHYIAAIISIKNKESFGDANHFRGLLKGYIERLHTARKYKEVNHALEYVRESAYKFNTIIFQPKNKVWDLQTNDNEQEALTGEKELIVNSLAKLVNNLDAERVQIITEEKPSDEIRAVLKSKGFRWSPRFTAWQRKNTPQAISIATRVFIHLFPEPTKKTKEKPEPKPEKQKEQMSLFGLKDNKAVSLDNWKPNTHITPLKGELGQFIGGYERNQFALVLRGEKGAGKTRLLCQLIDLFAKEGLNCMFKSLEVSPESELFGNYVRYIKPENKSRVFVDANTSIETLEAHCKKFDCIAIDSWGKLNNVGQEDFGRLVEKYPKVVWLVIFQSTTSGTARGGIMSEYDSSIVVQVAKGGDAECEKNRYNSCDKVYNVFTKKMIKDEN